VTTADILRIVALEADYIDSGLNTFVKQLAAAYSRLPVTMDTPCGYACSDHASWYKYGYPTTMPFEAVTGNDNQLIHSSSDTTSVSGFSWSHSLEFAKVALAFAVELTSA
jgi:bacterial leucyl aminopeptidase